MVHSFSSVSILPSLQALDVLLSRANVADIAGCVVFTGYDLRIVLGPMFHSAILLVLDDIMAIKEAAMSSPSLVFWGSFVVVSTCQRPSALSPQAWKTAPPAACGTNGGCLSNVHVQLEIVRNGMQSLLSLPTCRPRLFSCRHLRAAYHDDSMVVGLYGLYTTKWQPLNAKDTRISDAPFVFSMAV